MQETSAHVVTSLEERARSALTRAVDAVQRGSVSMLALLNAPTRLRDHIAREAGCSPGDVIVTGNVEKRVVVIKMAQGRGMLASFSSPLVANPISRFELKIETPNEWLSACEIPEDALFLLTRPRVKIVALYHPEIFPLPRFALGISDLARAIRTQMVGQVDLLDMQLGASIQEIISAVANDSTDIVGVSATFGQHDILHDLMTELQKLREKPLTVIGGSLAALDASYWSAADPSMLIASGPGEETMQDVVLYWHQKLPRSEIRGLTAGESRSASVIRPRQSYSDYVPELDLLGATLDAKGVMQMESSRGCTHSCSFCPREHKGIWAGGRPDLLEKLITHIDCEFEQRRWAPRRIFLVDEEFVGLDDKGTGLARASEVASILHRHNFTFETSSRIDQVYRGNRSRQWHLDRIAFWRGLRRNGLDRCLFGVESGVDSILSRFNKKINGDQSILALRILSACGVPIRCTYITFDPLMTIEELVASYRWQGRADALLRPAPELSDEALFDAVHDPEFVAQQATGDPIYSRISYMLVSMECLLGSPYLRAVEDAGLAGEVVLSMGRRNARYRDPRLALLSHYSQCWIDRNFSLDYTLKSAEKFLPAADRAPIAQLRFLLKRSSYDILGAMLQVAEPALGVTATGPELVEKAKAAQRVWKSTDSESARGAALTVLLDAAAAQLVDQFSAAFAEVAPGLPQVAVDVIGAEAERWIRRSGWSLINAH